MKKTLTIVALIIVAALIVFFAYQKGDEQENQEQPALTSMTDGSNTIIAHDQGAGSSVMVQTVILEQSGFVVIHEDADGAPGAILGVSELLIGAYESIQIPLDRETSPGETLYAMLHTDDNDGVFEFPDADEPLRDEDGDILMVPFQITGSTPVDENNSDTSGDVPADNTEDTGTVTHVVTYSDSGYEPSQITIAQGDTVTFRNNSSDGMWTASAVHPTHTVYPDSNIQKCFDGSDTSAIFDSCQEITPGSEWSFTFTHGGEWGYHNHLRAQHTGRVVVE